MRTAGKLILLLTMPLLYMWGCSPDVAGTGTETSTKSASAQISGTIVDRSGTLVTNAVVQLVPTEYDPVAAPTGNLVSDMTDSNGRYFLETSDSGTFNIEAIQLSSSTKALIRNIEVSNDTIEIGQATLAKTGSIQLVLPDHADPVHGYVYIEGTTIVQEVGTNQDTIIITGVPSTDIPAVYYSQQGDPSEAVMLAVNINISADDTTSVFQTLLVVGDSQNLRENDILMKSNLQKIGGNVISMNDECLCIDDAAGFDVIIISSSCAADTVDGYFKDVPIPVIVCENDIYGDMMLTGPEPGEDFSNLYDPGTMSIVINEIDHPIAGNLSGTIQVFETPHAVSWGVPSDGASIIALCGDSLKKAALFCYEKDSMMVGMSAPAKRVGFFADFNSSFLGLNETGWRLFEQTVLWTLGRLE